MRYFNNMIGAGCLLACLALSSCGGEPYAYETDRELKPGPGFFSGEDGVFEVISLGEEETKETQASTKNEKNQILEE